jgi:hypothetical protein
MIAISGNTWRTPTNLQIIEVVSELLTDTNFEVEIYAGIAVPPHFNPDIEDEGPPRVLKIFC